MGRSCHLVEIFRQDVILANSEIFNNKFKKVSFSFLGIFFLLDVFNGIKFTFPVTKWGVKQEQTFSKENHIGIQDYKSFQ